MRILKDGQTEAAGKYTIGSTLSGIGNFSTNNNWNTEQQIPKLNGYSTPSNIKNTDKTTLTGASSTDITSTYFMRVAPQEITSTNTSLFTVTLPDGSTLTVPAGSTPLTIEPGNCYLFTVNISRETTLEIAGIESILMNEKKDMTVVDNLGSTRGIYTLDHLKAFRDAANSRKSLDKWTYDGVVKLYADIDLENTDWTPIHNFDGTFDGNGHTISNLAVSFGHENNAGFFCNAGDNSEIKGLTIHGAAINCLDYEYAGVIAGKSSGKIIDCHVKGPITNLYSNYFGGIVGNYRGDEAETPNKFIAACTVETDGSSSINSNIATGGIVGYFEKGYILGCIAHDMTFGNSSGNLGGIAGDGSSTNTAKVVGCIAYNCSGRISFKAGGICSIANEGMSVNINITDSYFYNVFGITSPTTDPNISAAGYLSSFNELNQKTSSMNNYVKHYTNNLCYFKASSNPSVTGPTIHMGEEPR